MSAEGAVLCVSGLEVEYPTRSMVKKAVQGVEFELARGEVLGITGRSGAGKSTAALAILGLARHPGRIVGGSVMFQGRDLLRLPEDELRAVRGKDLSFIPQSPRGALHPMARIGDQVASVVTDHLNESHKDARERALTILRAVGINDPERRYTAYPHELSGGMAQRVAIAMALVCSPQVVIADEPTSGLDVTIQAQVLDDLAAAVRDAGVAVVIVTQNLGVVANYCDRVIVMADGRVATTQPVAQFFDVHAEPVREVAPIGSSET
jgi:ABC-type glutathione transport system ATPase component